MRRSSAASRVCAPITPLSWWMQAPRSFTAEPLMRMPTARIDVDDADAEQVSRLVDDLPRSARTTVPE